MSANENKNLPPARSWTEVLVPDRPEFIAVREVPGGHMYLTHNRALCRQYYETFWPENKTPIGTPQAEKEVLGERNSWARPAN